MFKDTIKTIKQYTSQSIEVVGKSDKLLSYFIISCVTNNFTTTKKAM